MLNNLSIKLLAQIIDEYKKRSVDEKMTGDNRFETQFFINKYGYSSDCIDKLLSILHNNGYISKEIIDSFSLNVD